MKQSSVLRTGSLTLEESLAPDKRAAIYFRSTSDAAREFYSLEPAQGTDTSLRINRHNAAGQIIASGVLKDSMTNPVDAEPTFTSATITGNLTVAGSVNAKLDIVRITGGGPVPAAYFGKHIYAAAGNYSAGLTLPTTGVAPGTTVTVINGSGGAIPENTTGRLIVDDAAATFVWHREGTTGPSYWIATLTGKAQTSLSVGKLNADPGFAMDISGALKASGRIEAPVISATAASPTVSLTSAGRTNLLGPIMVGGTTANNYFYALDVVGSGNMSGGMTVGGGLSVGSTTTLKSNVVIDNSASLTVTGEANVGGPATLSGGATVGSAGLTVMGEATVGGAATVVGPAALSGGATVGPVGLAVTGPADLAGGAVVSGFAGLTVNSAATLSGGATVGSDGLIVNGPTTLKGGATVATGNVIVAGGNLTVGAGTLQVNQQNNTVGVNTANPLTNLHVTGKAFVGSGQTAISLEHEPTTDRGLVKVFDINNYPFGNPKPLALNPDSSVIIGSIFNTDVQAKLDVGGRIRSQSLRLVTGEFDNQPLTMYRPFNDIGVITQEGASNLLIQTGQNLNLMLRANGWLGINTPNPEAQVHMSFGNTAAQDWMVSQGSSGETPAIAPGLGYWSSMMGKGMSINTNNQITVYNTGVNAFGAGLLSGGLGTLDFLTSFKPGGANATFNPQDVTRMRITSDGNVGVGTLSPGHKLDVAGTAAASTYTFRQNATDDAPPVITYRSVPVDQGGKDNGTVTEMILFHSNDGENGAGPDRITVRAPQINLQTYNGGISSITDRTGANDRVVIDPNGNVYVNGAVDIRNTLNVTGTLTCGSLVISANSNLMLNGGNISTLNTSETFLIDNTVAIPNFLNDFMYTGTKKRLRATLVGGGGGGGSGGGSVQFYGLVGGGGGGSGFKSIVTLVDISKNDIFRIKIGAGGAGGVSYKPGPAESDSSQRARGGSDGGQTEFYKFSGNNPTPERYKYIAFGGKTPPGSSGAYAQGGDGEFGGGGAPYVQIPNDSGQELFRLWFYGGGIGQSSSYFYNYKANNETAGSYSNNGVRAFYTNNSTGNQTNTIIGPTTSDTFSGQDPGGYPNLRVYAGNGAGGGGIGGYDGRGVNYYGVGGSRFMGIMPGGGGGGPGGGRGGIMYNDTSTIAYTPTPLFKPDGEDGVLGGGGGGGAGYTAGNNYYADYIGGSGGKGGDGYVLLEFY